MESAHASAKQIRDHAPAPALKAKVKGDAGTYKVWGMDWLNHSVLLDRAGIEWTPIKNVPLEPHQEQFESRSNRD